MEFWMLCVPAKRRSLHVRTWFLFPYHGIVFGFFCVLWNFIWLSAFVQDMHGLVSKDIDIFKCVCACSSYIRTMFSDVCICFWSPLFLWTSQLSGSRNGLFLWRASVCLPGRLAISLCNLCPSLMVCNYCLFFKPVNFNSRKEQKCRLACSVASVYPLPTCSSWALTCVLKSLERGI